MEGVGPVELGFQISGTTQNVKLIDVKYTPNLPNNIISIGRLTSGGHLALFSSKGIQFKSKNGIIFAEGTKIGNMYKMEAKRTKKSGGTDFVFSSQGTDMGQVAPNSGTHPHGCRKIFI